MSSQRCSAEHFHKSVTRKFIPPHKAASRSATKTRERVSGGRAGGTRFPRLKKQHFNQSLSSSVGRSRHHSRLVVCPIMVASLSLSLSRAFVLGNWVYFSRASRALPRVGGRQHGRMRGELTSGLGHLTVYVRILELADVRMGGGPMCHLPSLACISVDLVARQPFSRLYWLD